MAFPIHQITSLIPEPHIAIEGNTAQVQLTIPPNSKNEIVSENSNRLVAFSIELGPDARDPWIRIEESDDEDVAVLLAVSPIADGFT